MQKIKLSRDCVYGKKGAIVEVSDAIAKQRIADGAAEPVRPARKKVSNKAMSSKE